MGASNRRYTMITISNTEQDLFTAIRAWLLTIVPGTWEVVQGQDNLVSMPASQFVVMTSAGLDRLATNIDVLDQTGLINNIANQFRYKIQLDFYGIGSSEYAAITSTLLRDQDTPDQFPNYIKPLYGDDLMQIPLVTAGSNYLERWKLTSYFQFNPVITNGTQSANVVNSGLVPVDIFFNA